MTLAALAALAYLFRPLSIPALPRDERALEFVDRSGLPLGTILGRGERRTLAVPLARVSPAFVGAVLAAEDRRFFFHGPVDWFAAARAVAASATRGDVPNGASTLSMQVARLIEPVPPGVAGKLREIVLAYRLENGNVKRDILAAYCNLAPMGSNLYGVEAAARTYFGIDAAQLDLAQAALLAALPNDPTRLDPYRHRGALEARRRYVLARMAASGLASAEDAARASREQVALRPRAFGIASAAHYLFHLAPRVPDGLARVRTSLDRPLQNFVEAQVRDVVTGLSAYGMHQAAAIVLDNHTGEVLAYVGSPDYFADDDFGRNDGVQALRQPGSALKPFLYELALERRVVRPDTILADVPTAYGMPGARTYRPSDYSSRFLGPVRVRAALANSLNVPAVRVLSDVGVENFRRRLGELGFAHLTRSAEFYGLGLTLGGGEVTLAELARAYATAARGGHGFRLVETLDDAPAPAPDVAEDDPVDPSWPLVTDMLADAHARAAAFGVDSILRLPFQAAVKTGTSSDDRDVWTAGYTRDYTVAVWAGNFDGSAMHGISGVTGAAPLWARIMLHLNESREPLAFAPPAGYVRKTICAQGDAATACTPVREWLDSGDLARRDAMHAKRANDPARTYDEWLIAQPGRARLPTRILFPHEGDLFVYDPNGGTAQRLAIELAGPRDATLAVSLDGRRLTPRGGDYLWQLRPGRHFLEAHSRRGDSRVAFTVAREGPRRHTGFSVAPAREAQR